MIQITTPKNTAIYPVKPNGGDYAQCLITDPEFSGWAVLRFTPKVAGEYFGSYFAKTASELIKYLPHTITFNSEGITAVDIFIRKGTDPWIQVGQSEPIDPANPKSVDFHLLPVDIDTYSWTPGTILEVKVKDSNTDVEEIITTIINGTITMTAPSFLEVGTEIEFTVSAETDIPDGVLHIDAHNKTQDTMVSFGTATIQESGGYFITKDITFNDADFDASDAVDLFVSRKDSLGNMRLSDSVEFDVVAKTINLNTDIDPFGGTVVLDEDIAFEGTATGLNGQGITLEAKKVADSEWTYIGAGMIDADAWATVGQLPSASFAVDDVVQIRARYEAVVSNVGEVTVESGDLDLFVVCSSSASLSKTNIDFIEVGSGDIVDTYQLDVQSVNTCCVFDRENFYYSVANTVVCRKLSDKSLVWTYTGATTPRGLFAYGEHIFVCDNNNVLQRLSRIRKSDGAGAIHIKLSEAWENFNPVDVCTDGTTVYATTAGARVFELPYNLSSRTMIQNTGLGNTFNSIDMDDTYFYVAYDNISIRRTLKSTNAVNTYAVANVRAVATRNGNLLNTRHNFSGTPSIREVQYRTTENPGTVDSTLDFTPTTFTPYFIKFQDLSEV